MLEKVFQGGMRYFTETPAENASPAIDFEDLPGVGGADGGRRTTTDDERRTTTNDRRRTTGRRTNDDGRRKTNDHGRRTTDYDGRRTTNDGTGFHIKSASHPTILESTGRDLAVTAIIMETFLNSIYTNRRTRFDKHTLFCTLRQASDSVTCL